MDVKDYYRELGLTPEADEKAIKQAYRKLARQYHPDVNTDDDQAAERFKAVNEAYQILGDPEKRKRYDELRQRYRSWQQYGGPQADWGQWQDAAGGQSYGYSSATVSPEDLQDLFGNADIFADLFGAAFAGGAASQSRPRRGRDVEMPVELTLHEALSGTRRTVQIGDKRLETRIPAGVQQGGRIRLSGQGYPGLGGGQAGDLYLNVHIMPHALFTREGDDLHLDLAVDMLTAALGGEVRVPTLDNADGTLKLKLPPRTQTDKRFRLRGKGMPRMEQPEQRGDLYVRIKVVLPEDLSDAELVALRQMQDARRGRGDTTE